MTDLPDGMLFVGGAWETGSGAEITSIFPADGSVNRVLAGASTADGERAIARAKAAQADPAWRNLRPHERARFLTRIADGIEANVDRISRIQTLDTGKTLKETRALAASAAGTFRYFGAALETSDETLTSQRGDALTLSVHEPLGLIAARSRRPAGWIWRCHIDLSTPQRDVWEFLAEYVNGYDAAVFSAPQFSRDLAMPQVMIAPSIDPLSDKNRDLAPSEIDGILERLHVQQDKPIVTQVSRFDRLKDPVGVIEAYRMARRYNDCRLVLAGGGATAALWWAWSNSSALSPLNGGRPVSRK